jgi:hypothetical protein
VIAIPIKPSIAPNSLSFPGCQMEVTYDCFQILKDWIISIGEDNHRLFKYWCIIEGREAVNGTRSNILFDRILKKEAGG